VNIQEEDFVDVMQRAQELGCRVPTGLAILPRNFESAASKDQLLHESEAPTVRILWRRAGLEETPIEPEGERFPQISEKSFEEWVGPTIFASAALLSENPALVSVAFGVISNYLTDWFKGTPIGLRKVRLDVVIEAGKREYKRLHYEGPVEGLQELAAVVREVGANERDGD
jgi:hypothetical protein